MSTRPYQRYGFDQLKQIHKDNHDNINVLKNVLSELRFRKKNRHLPAFKIEVEKSISVLSDAPVQQVSDDSVQNNIDRNTPEIEPTCELYNFREEDTLDFQNIDWIPEQRTVIELNEEVNSIVEAGPGTGKTAVACARVAHLIEHDGLDATQITLISFTRTAVKELKDRIEAFAEVPINMAGLKIVTLDSFTWQILHGYEHGDIKDLFGNYENNISGFVQRLQDADEQILEYLDELQHVVIDEGQDLVGVRADLIVAIVQKLNEECGVTLFADSAQAIYGFTDDSAVRESSSSYTVVERVNSGDVSGFSCHRLDNVHRTEDDKLKTLFRHGRDYLLGRSESDIDGWLGFKKFIQTHAHKTIKSLDNASLREEVNTLVLYRTRAEVLMSSSFFWQEGVAHKLRMSGIPNRTLPWLSRIFSTYENEYIDKQEFDQFWAEMIEDITYMPVSVKDSSWQLLFDNYRDKHGRINIVRLREQLSRDRPPIELMVDESQLQGPVVGTIHASKGREANHVYLMLPPNKYIDVKNEKYARSPKELAEEERVLFVGATRARKQLYVGSGTSLYASKFEGRRTFRKVKNGNRKRQIEIGLAGDLDLKSLADDRLERDPQKMQDWLWEHASSCLDMECRYDHQLKVNVLYEQDGDTPIAIFSDRFKFDLWGITKIVSEQNGGAGLRPSQTIRHIRMVGVTSVVIPEAQRETLKLPWRHTGFLLAPIISGFPVVYFNG